MKEMAGPVEAEHGKRPTPPHPDPDQGDWRWQIQNLILNPEELGRFLNHPLPEHDSSSEGSPGKMMWVTPYYAGLARPEDPHDPILRQILPTRDERMPVREGSQDPLAEKAHSPLEGLVHRYPDRALIKASRFCPTLCRFCLRKSAWASDPVDPAISFQEILRYIKSKSAIRDVILSGGDPLCLPLSKLEEILQGLREIPHVRLIRIGSRTPVTLPMRIDSDVEDLCRRFKPIWFMTHFNHPREITGEAKKALAKLASAGAVLNNQSVLLRGVNDSTSTLTDLSVHLLEAGVRPYYLHQVDYVEGIDHFRVPVEEGVRIIRSMFGAVSGMGIPRYVLDLPGGKGKVPLMPDFVQRETDEERFYQGPLGGIVPVPKEGK